MAPLPVLPLLAISMSLLSQMFVQVGLFSYGGYMVKHLDVVDNKDKAGYYAGLLASSFMIGRITTSYFWGVFADRYGRLPVMYIGLWSVAILSIGFGLSTTYYAAFLFRFFIGFLNGIMAASKMLVAEVCGEEHGIVGMGAVTTAWSLALVIGPGVGGILAEPATYYPSMFSESGIFGRYPYLLPNMVGSGLALLTLPMVYCFLTETRQSDECSQRFESLKEDKPEDKIVPMSPLYWAESPRNGSYHNHLERASSKYDDVDGSTVQTPPNGNVPSWAQYDFPQQHREDASASGPVSPGVPIAEAVVMESLFGQQPVRTICFLYGVYSFCVSGFEEVFPLWALSTVASGGLDWTTQGIGQMLLACGGALLGFELFAVPCITKKIGVTTSQRFASSISVLVNLVFPVLSRLHDTGRALVVAVFVFLFAAHTCSTSMFINISLVANNSTTASRRGELNGMMMMVGSIAKAAGPAVCSAVFAASTNSGWAFPLDFHLVFLFITFGILVLTVVGWNSVTVEHLKSGSTPEKSNTDEVGEAEAGRAEGGVEDRYVL